MDNFINAVLNAGFAVSQALKKRDESLYRAHHVGAGGDISIGADLVSEEIFIRALNPFGNIDSEESGFIDNRSDFTIIIDPLDGSDNFLSSVPYYGASVALCEAGNIHNVKIGIIINFCNHFVIVSDGVHDFCGNLGERFRDFVRADSSHIAPKCGIFERAYSNPHICAKLKDNRIKFRSLGALALSLGLSHRVNFVLFSGQIRKYDVAAGFLVARNLHRFEHENFVLISKDKQLFDNISKLLC